MPFRVPLDKPVSGMAAGEKQKLEILKLLYLDQRFLILDEPTSVLTPGEADEILGLLREMAHRGDITVAMISHKFREVEAFCDDFTVLRRGVRVGGGKVGAVSTREMAALMIGDAVVRPSAARVEVAKSGTTVEIAGLYAENDEGPEAVAGFDIRVHAGEIVGIAGVSGNGQSELIQALSGQRPIKKGQVLIRDMDFEPKRGHFDKFKIFGLPEEPLKNASVPTMSHGVPQVRKSPDDASRFLAVARADARHGTRPHRPLQCQDAVHGNANSRSVRRQCAARRASAGAFGRGRRADPGQSLLRSRLRFSRRHP
jgi:simple sugar transport system ATP-binding protein